VKSGDFEIRYRSDALEDFKRTDFLATEEQPTETAFLHPAAFSGPFTLDVDCYPTRKGGLRTKFRVGIETDDDLIVSFGTCPEEVHERYWAPQIYRYGANEALDSSRTMGRCATASRTRNSSWVGSRRRRRRSMRRASGA
jgi:hypothetical protein